MTIKNYKNVRDLTGQRFGKLVARSVEKPVRVFKCGNVSNTSRYMSA